MTTDGQPTALPDERLAEIRQQVDEYARKVFMQSDVEFGFGLHELLAEVERLHEVVAAAESQVAQWREIGRKLDAIDRDATGELVTSSLYIMDCPYCHKRIIGPVDDEPRYPPLPKLGHRPGCIVLKARALLER